MKPLTMLIVACCGAFATVPMRAQVPTRSASVEAAADGFSTQPGGRAFTIPGVGEDFVLFADGQWLARADGTARLSIDLERQGAIDRDLVLVLELAGRVEPGQPSFPPPGAMPGTLLPAAYAPNGPVDPQTFVYFTTVTGTLTGLRGYTGLRADVTAAAPLQIGVGANDRNALLGLAADLDIQVVQAPLAETFAPTGPGQLRLDLPASQLACATHVDHELGLAGNQLRVGFALAGVGDDYLLAPGGAWTELPDGTALLAATLRRASDWSDAFALQLVFGGRIDPLDATHPPPNAPVLGLLPQAYAAQGGTIDPDQWRYYGDASGTLTGIDARAGAVLQLDEAGPTQVGVGANQGNEFFGLAAALQVTLQSPPTSGTLAPTGAASVHANLAVSCILPQPLVTGGDGQQIPTVNGQRLTFTGDDLGFVVQAAIGPNIAGDDVRRWLDGFVHVVDNHTLEFAVPQGLPPATMPLVFLNASRISNPLTVTLTAPTTPVAHSEPDRLTGETQHWLMHRGNVAGFAFVFLLLSLDAVPSSAPGLVDLDLGNQFSSLVIFDVAALLPGDDIAQLVLAAVPPSFAGARIYFQAALMDAAVFPLTPSNLAFTDY